MRILRQLSDSERQNFNSKKRRRSSSSSPSTNETDRSPKHPRISYRTSNHSTFWDGLSKIPLCPAALREFNCRTRKQTATALVPHRRRSRRLAVRRPTAGNDHPPPIVEFLNQCSKTSLHSVKNLARHGGPDLADLRGYPPPKANGIGMSSSQSSLGRRKRGSQSPIKRDSTATTTTTRSTGPYDRAFQQHLIDHDILPDGYEYPDGRLPTEPDNMKEILEELAKPRPSLSPSRFTDDDFRRFKRADTHAVKESLVVSRVIPAIEGDIGDSRCAASEVPFTNLDHLTDGTLVPAKPDLYYGARPEQLNRQVRRDLDGSIVPSSQHDLPIAPNMFVEVKGPDGSAAVAKRQLAYDIALGERGQQALRSYKAPKSVFDNNAHTIGYTYQDGTLKMYVTHQMMPTAAGRQPVYAMTQVDSWSLTGNANIFRKGATAYRNGRDWAKQKREEAIEQANKNVHDADCRFRSLSERSAATTMEPTSQSTIVNHRSNTPSVHSQSDTDSSTAYSPKLEKPSKSGKKTISPSMSPRNQAALQEV